MSGIKEDIKQLSDKVTVNSTDRGEAIIEGSEASSRQLILWLQYFMGQKTGTADCLLDGTMSAIRESAACLCLGLARPALNSLRLQIDLLLAWLYFKDHPVEWERVKSSGDGYKLKTDLLKYFGETNANFIARLGLLRNCKGRQTDDPYRLLSAHIHGQSEYVIPVVMKPIDIVATVAIQDDVITLQGECSEYLGDICWSLYAERWASVPQELKTVLMARFKSEKQRAAFFA